MMMRCILGASDLTSDHIEHANDKNPNGFFEVAMSERMGPDFPLRHDGGLVKCFIPDLLKLPVAEYRVVAMRRRGDEIIESAGAMLPGRSLSGPRVEAQRDRAYEILAVRSDVVSITVLDYADVVADPVAAFTKLFAAGWAISPKRAAELVDPELYRTRL